MLLAVGNVHRSTCANLDKRPANGPACLAVEPFLESLQDNVCIIDTLGVGIDMLNTEKFQTICRYILDWGKRRCEA
jgi:hypothetical protein